MVYNADMEEPNCSRCDYCCGGFDCEGSCGPKHGWYGYTRTGEETEQDDSQKSLKKTVLYEDST